MTKEGRLNYGGLQNSYSFPHSGAGRISPGTSVYRGPSIPCEQVYFRAHPDNGGTVYFGGADVNSTSGMPLAAGEYSPWLPVQNIDQIYFIADNDTDYIQYFMVR